MKELLIKSKIVFDRGRYWLSYLTFFMLVFVTVTNLKSYSYFEFLQGRYWLIILLAASIIAMFLLGYVELKYLKTYQKEVEVLGSIDPNWQKSYKNDERILEKLSELEGRIDELSKKIK